MRDVDDHLGPARSLPGSTDFARVAAVSTAACGALSQGSSGVRHGGHHALRLICVGATRRRERQVNGAVRQRHGYRTGIRRDRRQPGRPGRAPFRFQLGHHARAGLGPIRADRRGRPSRGGRGLADTGRGRCRQRAVVGEDSELRRAARQGRRRHIPVCPDGREHRLAGFRHGLSGRG